MEFTFLGTSAGEQYPGFWCHCENCEKARKLGGRNIRKNAAAWIAPNCLIDFPSEIFMQAERFNVDITEAEILLITHSHEDHLFPYLLRWRKMSQQMDIVKEQESKQLSAPRFTKIKPLKILGNKAVCNKIKEITGKNLQESAIELILVEPYKTYEIGDMKIMPLLANHPDDGEYGLNYIIEKEGKKILYALDTGWFLPETLSEIKKHKFDFVTVEGTCGYGEDNANHLNFKHVKMAYEFLKDNDLLKNEKGFYVTHLSPHWTPVHDEIDTVLGEQGIITAYDGLKINI